MLTLASLLLCLLVRGEAQSGTKPVSLPPLAKRQNSLATIPADSGSFTPHIPTRAIRYQRATRTLLLVAMLWNPAGLALFLALGFSARLRNAVFRALRLPLPAPETPPPFRAVVLFFSIFALITRLWSLPFGLAALWLEHHYGFSQQSVLSFLGDTLLGLLFSFMEMPLIWGAYWLYCRTPKRWWLWLWGVLTPLLFVQIVLTPVLIAPAYNRFTPLPPGQLREKLLSLAGKAGITGGRVLVQDTSRRTRKVNAYVTGLGPTTRIVLNDTALNTLPEDQLLAMMGHEMGHYVEGHVWFLLAGSVLGAGVFLWIASWLLPLLARRQGKHWGIQGLSDLAALPLVMLMLSLFLLLQEPVASGESRFLERRADRFGLKLTGLNEATAHLMVGFAERDYADPDPPALLQFWFGTHPTLSERIQFARNTKE